MAFALALASCGGRSSKPGATTPAAQRDQCYEPSSVSGNGGDADSAPASEGSADYDYDSCISADPEAAPMFGEEEEISQLWNEIRDMRVGAGLDAEPLASDSSKMQPLSVSEIQEEHADPTTQICIATCKIEKSICKNADKICRLADNLGGNEWATEKCNSGKASCQEANKKCAACVAAEATTVTP
jgi:hypothetical protein